MLSFLFLVFISMELFVAFYNFQLAESAKLQFSAKDYSDHLALIRAYAGWKKADAEGTGYDYCWKNFLSAQTMRAMDSLRKQFLSLLKDAGLVGDGADFCNMWSCDEYLIRSVICAGLYPGVCSAVVRLLSYMIIKF